MNNDTLLSMASYFDFINSQGKLFSKEKQKEILEQRVAKGDITSSQAKHFINNEVLAQKSTKSGYSGTIVRNKHTNEIIVAHKGTQSAQGWLQDGILVIKGLPQTQASDAKAFVDDAIKSGLIKGNFRNVDHNLCIILFQPLCI